MKPDERIDAWARERRTADVPPGFADRVAAAATQARRERVVRAAVIGLAAIAGAIRVAAAFAVFFTRS